MFGVCSPALHRFSISFSQNSTTQINSNRWNKEQLDLLLIQYYPRVNSNKCPNTSTDRLTMRAGRQMQPLYRRLNHCVCDARVTYRRIAERFGCRKRVRLCGHVVCVGPLRYAVAETAVAVPKPHDPVTRSLSASISALLLLFAINCFGEDVLFLDVDPQNSSRITHIFCLFWKINFGSYQLFRNSIFFAVK